MKFNILCYKAEKTDQAVGQLRLVLECAWAADENLRSFGPGGVLGATPSAVEGAGAARAPGVMYFISNTLMLYGSNYIICIFSDTPGDI